jgi:UDP-N-acetylmuramoyl-L-alanyl-D-glutamate--2,6-diaminopimelate ligase
MSEPQAPSVAAWTLRSLFAAGEVAVAGNVPTPETPVRSLTDDSRAAAPGSCFVAVRGTGRDGHDFVEAAVRSGAASVVVERDVRVPQHVALVRVNDTRMALARLAAAFYGLRDSERSPKLVGITGTNGKTTVAWMVRSILRAAKQPAALLGTIEYDLLSERRPAPLTTPGSLELCRSLALARDAGASVAALEVSSHALDQRRCDGLNFRVGVFTNLTGDHLDYHKTMDAYFAAKRRLFEALSPYAAAVVNADDPYATSLAEATRARVVRYGLDPHTAGFFAEVRGMDRSGTDFLIRLPGDEVRIRFPLIGRHNVLNALAAAAAGHALDVPMTAVREGLESIDGVPGRLQRAEPASWPFSAFVDYAHTDDALRNVLGALRPVTAGRLACVFGCGGDRDRSKRPRMASVVEELADAAYVTSDNPRSEDPHAIINEIMGGFTRRRCCEIAVEADRKAAIEMALGRAGEGDTVLIAGKGHENYQLLGKNVLPFDDLEVARQWFTRSQRRREVA